MIKISSKGFELPDGTIERTVIGEYIVDETALQKQDNSFEEYEQTHQDDGNSEEVRFLADQFGDFISDTILCHLFSEGARPLNVLDVGCGIGVTLPAYVKRFKDNRLINYIGLDPIPINMNRDYLFFNGIFESIHKQLEPNIDVFLFSTSLDHFPDLEEVKNVMVNAGRSNAVAIVWSGLHDGDHVARHFYWRRLSRLNVYGLAGIAKGLVFSLLSFFFLPVKIWIRDHKLNNNRALDDLHFHYFLERDLDSILSSFGKIINKKVIFGSSSAFYAIRLK